jgi:hypothetical protein
MICQLPRSALASPANSAHELRAGSTHRTAERRAACRTLQTASASGATPVASDHARRPGESDAHPCIR